MRWSAVTFLSALVLASSVLHDPINTSAGAAVAAPETVMITLRAKAGQEAQLAAVLAQHWTTVRTLNLATPDHLTLRGAERDGKTFFVEVMTWRDASIPDAAPAEIQAIWNQMQQLVEARDGHVGLEIVEMTVVHK